MASRLKCVNKENILIETRINEIIDNKTFTINDEIDDDSIFVYGIEVDDFHSLIYQNFYIMAISAIKGLDKIVQEQNEALKQRLSALETKMNSMFENLKC